MLPVDPDVKSVLPRKRKNQSVHIQHMWDKHRTACIAWPGSKVDLTIDTDHLIAVRCFEKDADIVSSNLLDASRESQYQTQVRMPCRERRRRQSVEDAQNIQFPRAVDSSGVS